MFLFNESLKSSYVCIKMDPPKVCLFKSKMVTALYLFLSVMLHNLNRFKLLMGLKRLVLLNLWFTL